MCGDSMRRIILIQCGDSMAKYPSQKCYEGTWQKKLPSMLFFIMLCGFLFPLPLCIFFYRNWHHQCNPAFVSRFGSLISPYKSKFFYWELINAFRRTIFMISNAFLSSFTSIPTRFLIGVAISISFVWMDIHFTPFLKPEINHVIHLCYDSSMSRIDFRDWRSHRGSSTIHLLDHYNLGWLMEWTV